MTKTAAPSTSKTGDGESRLPAFPAMNPADVERFFETNRAIMQNMLDINRGLFDFVDSRLKADVATFDELCQCKDWQDVSKVQSRFVSSLTQQYVDQTTKLMDAAAKMLAAQRTATKD